MKNLKTKSLFYHKRYIMAFFLFCFLAGGKANILFAEDPAEIKQYLRKTTAWNCESLNKEVPVNIYYITRSTHSRPWNIGSPVLVYVKNFGEKRIGEEPDSTILLDYIKEHYIVVTIDFGNDPDAVSPHFDKDLHNLFRAIYNTGEISLFEGVNLTPREFRCFIVPAGYRVATDLLFWEIDKHGAFGTMEFIMESYNNKIAGVVYGKEKVKSPEEMTDRHGRPFRYKMAMDIVYPSRANKKVPLVFFLSTQVTRHPNQSPRSYRPHLMGLTLRGYATAIIDQCYDPVRRHFWYTNKFSLAPWNGLASYTAGIRFIRANAQKFNIDQRYIGGMGHSKGEYSIARLSDPNHMNQEEQNKFKGFPQGSPEPQPNQGYSSRISAGYQSPGNWAQFISAADVPTIVAHGDKDTFGRKYADTFKKLEELDVNHVSLLMKGLGHDLPYGYDEELGFDRYKLFHDFFDRYLKVEEKLPPAVLMITPRNQQEDASPSTTISIHFAPELEKKSVTGGGVKIIRKRDNNQVKGSWKISRHNTKFIFTPENLLEKDQKYKIVISTQVKNQAGTHLAKEKISEFQIKDN